MLDFIMDQAEFASLVSGERVLERERKFLNRYIIAQMTAANLLLPNELKLIIKSYIGYDIKYTKVIKNMVNLINKPTS